MTEAILRRLDWTGTLAIAKCGTYMAKIVYSCPVIRLRTFAYPTGSQHILPVTVHNNELVKDESAASSVFPCAVNKLVLELVGPRRSAKKRFEEQDGLKVLKDGIDSEHLETRRYTCWPPLPTPSSLPCQLL